MHYRIAFLCVFVHLPTSSALQANEPTVDFAREVLPVLSNKCFVCHGPDAEEGELRLDSLEAATADLGGYQAINLGAPDESELLDRIHSSDEPMPPEDAEKQLTASERDLLSRWIKQGATYAKHWAFVPPVKRLPDGVDVGKPQVIDAFIGKQLAAKTIEFADPVDKRILARRAALVLTGLPPEPEQLQQFLGDTSDKAYSRLLDQLFASPRFGEHQARYWLDAVRYGDTHGLHLDNRRGIYPYRDWVVRSLNQNLPLDQFIQWQLAGDLFPEATLEQQIATGFVRLNPSTGEGGAIPAEFQAKNNFDRVETFGTVFLGMSLTCARCHTHKYDPIPQTEYYRLLAFFNNTAEPAMDGNSYTYGPTVRTPADQRAWEDWEKLTSESQALLAKTEDGVSEAERLELIEYAKSRTAWKANDWSFAKPSKRSAPVPTRNQLEKIGGLPGNLSGRGARGKLPNGNQATWITWNLSIPKSQTIWITFSGAAGSALFVSDSAEPIIVKDTLDRVVTAPVRFKAGKHHLRLRLMGGPSVTEIEVQVKNHWDVLARSKSWDACDSHSRLQMLSDPYGPMASLANQDAVSQLAKALATAQFNFTTTLVAKELPKVRETKVLKRGEYDMPEGDALEPGILKVMSSFPQGAPRNRMGLAQWLTDPQHPLTSRVLINRIWQRVFGEGLVRTPEDFGLQGQQPTHPELLDWLAVELQESRWDLKHMLRLMVSSRTFKQQSAWRTDVDDPENRLLARGPSYRLDAEVLRDMALWSSRLLDPHMGGEGVKPYQPGGMWKALAHPASNTKDYQRDKGQRLYRRSLYVYWKRTSPHPMMTLFDAPDRESSCVRRSRTSTALQSLGMFNETQRVEMARALAGRLIREASSDAERLDFLFQLIGCRGPSESERAACRKLLLHLKDRYANDSEAAIGLLSTGDALRDESLDLTLHAAWTQVATTVLASDLAILLY